MKTIYAILLLLGLSGSLSAQYIMGINYDVSLPSGELHNFVSSASFMGFNAEGRVYVDKNKTVGLTIGWTRFIETSDEPLLIDGNWYYEPQERSAYIMPFLLNFHYYLDLSKDSRLYGGLNGGFYYIVQKFKVTSEKLLNNTLHLGIVPEAGVIQDWGSGIKGMFGVRYNYVLPRKNSIAFSHWSFYLGLAIQTSYF